MKNISSSVLLENRIYELRKRLDNLLSVEPVNSAEVLRISQQLDALITGYYRKEASYAHETVFS